jgi:hypothetical protein
MMLLTFAEFAEGIQLEWYLRKFILFPAACNCSRDDQEFSLMIPCPFILKAEIHSISKLLKKIIFYTFRKIQTNDSRFVKQNKSFINRKTHKGPLFLLSQFLTPAPTQHMERTV